MNRWHQEDPYGYYSRSLKNPRDLQEGRYRAGEWERHFWHGGHYGQYRPDSDRATPPMRYERGAEVLSQESQPTRLTTTYRFAQPSRPRGPRGYTRSDERIREDICERLMSRDDIDASDVTVTVGKGAVKLTGSVPERAMRYSIEDVVAECPGVHDVDNAVRVEREPQD